MVSEELNLEQRQSILLIAYTMRNLLAIGLITSILAAAVQSAFMSVINVLTIAFIFGGVQKGLQGIEAKVRQDGSKAEVRADAQEHAEA